MDFDILSKQYQSYPLYFAAACDVGNYRDAATNACKKCAKGFYQDKPWQDACTKCTTDTTTVNEGSKSKEDCQSRYILSNL